MSDESREIDGIGSDPKKSGGVKIVVGIIIAVVCITAIVLWIAMRYINSDNQNRYTLLLKNYYSALMQSDTNASATLTAENFVDTTPLKIGKGSKVSVYLYSVSDPQITNVSDNARTLTYNIVLWSEKPSQSFLNVALVDKKENGNFVLISISNMAHGPDIMDKE